jgi:hypothetical protein
VNLFKVFFFFSEYCTVTGEMGMESDVAGRSAKYKHGVEGPIK